MWSTIDSRCSNVTKIDANELVVEFQPLVNAVFARHIRKDYLIQLHPIALNTMAADFKHIMDNQTLKVERILLNGNSRPNKDCAS